MEFFCFCIICTFPAVFTLQRSPLFEHQSHFGRRVSTLPLLSDLIFEFWLQVVALTCKDGDVKKRKIKLYCKDGTIINNVIRIVNNCICHEHSEKVHTTKRTTYHMPINSRMRMMNRPPIKVRVRVWKSHALGPYTYRLCASLRLSETISRKMNTRRDFELFVRDRG